MAGPYVTIHLRDVPAVVRAKAGATGSLVSMLAPKTIEGQVYDGVRSKVAEALDKEGVAADVAVVAEAPQGGGWPRDLLTGAALGAGAVGFGWLAWRILLRRLFAR